MQIDNSCLFEKIALREHFLLDEKNINVLDLFAGDNVIWDNIKKKSNKNINILGIDKKRSNKKNLHGDNIKFLMNMNLNKFNVFDFDAYGVPYKQLKEIFKKKDLINKHYFVTFILSVYGGLPKKLLEEIGYPKSMIKKCPTLFYRNGFEKFKLWLALNGVSEISYINKGSKYFIYFFK